MTEPPRRVVIREDQMDALLHRMHRQEMALHAMGQRITPGRHGWLKFLIKDLETNPHTQYKVHLYGVVYWLINFPAIACLFFFAPSLWVKLGIFITLIYSIYANFATDYGAMSAAMAAFGEHPPEIPLETPGGAP